MIYLDTSALAKLVLVEAETKALTNWLHERSRTVWVTSTVGHIELLRLARRHNATPAAEQLLDGLDMVPLAGRVPSIATQAGPVTLRTLDAIHLASALSIRDELTAFCCYDQRLADAARAARLPVEAPT